MNFSSWVENISFKETMQITLGHDESHPFDFFPEDTWTVSLKEKGSFIQRLI